MRLSTETQLMLRDIARSGGRLRYFDEDGPYSFECEVEARQAGLIYDRSAGAWDAGGTISLTNKGRELMGMPRERTFTDLLTSVFVSLRSNKLDRLS